MTVRLYRSSDASAPTLDGQAGSLITVLDACLVNGYGVLPAAGWTKAFSGTNQGDYRMGAGLQYYMSINDNAPGAGTGKEARVRGYEAMTALATGTNPFPTAAQATNGLFIRKSNTADATARTWVVLADQRTVFMFVLTTDSAGVYLAWTFGEIFSKKSVTDVGGAILIARVTENSAAITSGVEVMDTQQCPISSTIAGHYLARDVAATVGAIACGKVGDVASTVNAAALQALIGIVALTNPADNRIKLGPLNVTHISGGNTDRGRLRGLWHFCHPLTGVSDRDTFSGGDDIAGRAFLLLKQGGGGGVYILETSDTWDTN